MGNIDLRDPNVQVAGLGVFLSLAIAIAFFTPGILPFGYPARAERIAQLESEYEAISADLMKAKQTASRLPQVKAEYEELAARWEEAKTLLPTEKEMAELLSQVTVAGQRSGVEFLLFEPKPPIRREIYMEHPIEVTIQGGYHDIGLFLARLSNLPRIVNVNQIDMKNVPNPLNPELPDIVEANLSLSAYTLITDGAQVASARGGEPRRASSVGAKGGSGGTS
jgi:type IV pilus assembly protein PilO